MTKIDVGIDVAQERLDVAVSREARPWSVAHDAAGMTTLRARMTALAPERIGIEATGGLPVALATALQAAAWPVAVVHPRHARHCARSLGPWAKTDARDARTWARMAGRVRRRQIVAASAQEKARHHPAPPVIPARVQAPLDPLLQELAQIDSQRQALIQAHPDGRRRPRACRVCPG